MGHSSESEEASASETRNDVDHSPSEELEGNCTLIVKGCSSAIFVPDTEDDSTSALKKQHRCHYGGCNKQFSRPWRLAAHLCIHTGELPYKCSFEGCNKAYSSTSHLKRHTVNVHQPNKHETRFRCPHPGCDIEMKNQWNIKKHYKSKHQPKAFKCTDCAESFRKHSQLKSHTYSHTGVPPFHCTKCSAGFLKVGDLNRHMRHHRSHICGIGECHQIFENWTQLRKHKALEHPKEFICEHCNKVFHSKARHRSHVIAHKDKSEREVILCPYSNCGRFYFEKKNLDHHIRSSHQGKTFPCTYPGCGRQLSSQLQILWPTI